MKVQFDKIYWHEAFFEALQLEFKDYLDILHFDNEFPLSKEALIIDALVIRKDSQRQISKNIGRIFKGHNIFEFKSEKDTITWQDYNKVMAYAYLYSAFKDVPVNQITLSFCVTMHPRNLLKYLEHERKFEIAQVEPGVYYVTGDTFPIQILESKMLSQEENLFVRNLRSQLQYDDALKTLTEYEGIKGLNPKNAYLDRLLKANAATFRKVIEMTESFADTLADILDGTTRWEARINRQAQGLAEKLAKDMAQDMAQDIAQDMAHRKVLALARKLLGKGLAPEEIAESMEVSVEDLLALA